jgi:hypothetical protein
MTNSSTAPLPKSLKQQIEYAIMRYLFDVVRHSRDLTEYYKLNDDDCIFGFCYELIEEFFNEDTKQFANFAIENRLIDSITFITEIKMYCSFHECGDGEYEERQYDNLDFLLQRLVYSYLTNNYSVIDDILLRLIHRRDAVGGNIFVNTIPESDYHYLNVPDYNNYETYIQGVLGIGSSDCDRRLYDANTMPPPCLTAEITTSVIPSIYYDNINPTGSL